jgi:molecular chaperone GrpE
VTEKTKAEKSKTKKQHGKKVEIGEEKVNISAEAGKARATTQKEEDAKAVAEEKVEAAGENAAPAPTKEELLQEEVDKLKDEQLRDRAEMENTRKRLERQKQDTIRYASLPLMRELLTVIDNLELALKFAAEDDPLRSGVNMALDGMKKTLTDHNCKPINSVGKKFDPAFHEALTTAHDPGKDDDIIIEEHRTGYILHDRVVRAAGVIVNKKPAEPVKSEKTEEKKAEETIEK